MALVRQVVEECGPLRLQGDNRRSTKRSAIPSTKQGKTGEDRGRSYGMF